MRSFTLVLAALLALQPDSVGAASTFRLYDGITAYVPSDGRAFQVKLEVRDLNLMETGPREILVKIDDPAGRHLVRTIIPDDGITSKAYLPAAGAWDHEAWYYAHLRMHGAQPLLRWSTFSAPDRFAAHPKRSFTYAIPAGPGGIYRIEIVGLSDHYVTLSLDPDLPFGVNGHPTWLHGSPLRETGRSYLYVPRGTRGLFLMAAEFDQPHTRRFTLTAADGQKLYDGTVTGGLLVKQIDFPKLGHFDDTLMTLDAGAGPDDYLVNVKFLRARDPEVTQRGESAAHAVFALDEKTVKAIQGGAIYHDDRVFWHPFQVRLHDWLKKLPAEEFVVKDGAGKILPTKRGDNRDAFFDGLPKKTGFLNVNDLYWTPPPCDGLMHHYQANKNRQSLNVAIRDLHYGLRSIGPGEVPAVAVGGPWANMAYEYSNYAWHYWRPAWRILQQSDAPAELKEIVHDAFLVCGDRLAFCVSWARTNGNSFAQLVAALRYCQEATGDPLQKKLFDIYWQRFTSGGWGERCGIGPSGLCQESFGYDHHYGSYMLGTWKAILADLADERFQKVYDRIRTVYSYTHHPDVAACPWSSRTDHGPHCDLEKTGPFAWKGLPGPDFTDSVNNGNEWFAARRPGYYVVTYHGRITPSWVGAAFAGQIGYGGGAICQLHVPGKGPVLASTLNGSYGEGMQLSNWRSFHLHSVVGQTADGKPLVGADSEHFDTKLAGTTVTSSGALRNSTVQVARTYQFEANQIQCSVQLKETEFNELLNLWIANPERGKLTECWEMIPYLPGRAGKPASKKPGDAPQHITLYSKDKIRTFEEKDALIDAIVIDRGGFGVRIELDRPRPVQLGQRNTLLIGMITGPTPAGKVSMSYRLVPFGGP